MNYPVIDMRATGAKIKSLRVARGLTVRDIQTALNLAEPQAIYKWQRGESLPSIDHLIALSQLLGVCIEDILVIQP